MAAILNPLRGPPLTQALAKLLAKPHFWWLCFAAWFALLWFLSSQPPGDLKLPKVPHLDKAIHLVYFGVGGTFLGLALSLSVRPLRSSHPQWLALYLLAVTLTIGLIGGIDEWRQLSTPGRTGGDPYDGLANILGGLLGAAIARRATSPNVTPASRR